MTGLLIDAAGWAGAAALLLAYGLVSSGRLNGRSIPFQLLNLFGALGLLANGIWHDASRSSSASRRSDVSAAPHNSTDRHEVRRHSRGIPPVDGVIGRLARRAAGRRPRRTGDPARHRRRRNDGSDAMYRSTSGLSVAGSTLPTKTNVKSLASANRSR